MSYNIHAHILIRHPPNEKKYASTQLLVVCGCGWAWRSDIVQQHITPFSHLLLLFHRRRLLYHVGRWPSFFTCFFWLSDLHAFFYDGILYRIYPIIREKCYYLLCIIMEHRTYLHHHHLIPSR